jgi:hypothetical protein
MRGAIKNIQYNTTIKAVNLGGGGKAPPCPPGDGHSFRSLLYVTQKSNEL